MREGQIIPVKSFKIMYFPFLILTIILILKIIFENILGVGDYENFFNIGILTFTIVIFSALLYIFKKNTVKINKFKKEKYEIRCSPIVLWITATFLTFVGFLVILGGFLLYDKYGLIGLIPGALFFSLGLIMWFESFTMKMVLTKDGIIVKCHRVFPFPGLFYNFDSLTAIKARGNLINFKHRQMFLGAQRFFIFDSPIFIKEMERYAPAKLFKN
ncbi:MAG: hypothetical protein JXA91_00435 [Candidatus Thermoplasmatota archaeon]|nr:hypothetical protein [Candidatus Thermoplasmatota archaeon]